MEVEESTRDKWRDHKDSTDKYGSMTHLIRVAVSNQIEYDKEFDDPFGEAVESGGSVDEELEKTLEDLGEALISVQNDLRALQAQVQGSDNQFLIENLMSGFHDLLVRTTEEQIEEGEVTGTTVDDLMDKSRSEGVTNTDVSEMDIRKALEQLVNDVPMVKSTVVDGERHYYELE